MLDQTDREKTLDLNFSETVQLLNQHQVPYWICHGSLLGLIRDGNLIPWDHDIDIAIWAGDISKKFLIELMTSNGYTLKSDGSDYDFVSFLKNEGREVDFNFYRISDKPEMSYSEWYICNSKLLSALEIISIKRITYGRWSWLMNKLFLFSPIASMVVAIFKKLGVFYSSAGYSTPTHLLKEFTYINIMGLKIRVPQHHKEILEFVYGQNWKVPKKQYDWVKESPATLVSNSRFNQSTD